MKTAFVLFAVIGTASALKVLTQPSSASNNDMLQGIKDIVQGKIDESHKVLNELDARMQITVVKCNADVPHINQMIDEDAKDIEEFSSRAANGKATAKAARSDIAELQEQIEAANAKIEKDNARKSSIQAAAKAKKQEIEDTMMALTNAIAKLESTASSFIQLPEADKATVLAFTQGADLDSSTGDLINTLKDARDEFRDELQKLVLSSDNEVNSLSMSVSANQGEVESSNNHIADLNEAANAADGDANGAKKNKVQSSASKSDNEALLKSTNHWCQETKTELRKLKKLASNGHSGLEAGLAALEADLMQIPSNKNHGSFIQLAERVADPQMKMLAFLAGKAKELKSKSLAQLVSKAEAAGQFDKVLGMIRNMMKELKSQGNEEEKHYRVCQTMKGDNKNALDRANDAVDEASSALAGAQQGITENTGHLQKSMKKQSSNEENWQTIKADTTAEIQTLEDENAKDTHFETTVSKALNMLGAMPQKPVTLMDIIKNNIQDTQNNIAERNHAIETSNNDMDDSEQAYKVTKAQVGPAIADFNSAVTDAVADQSSSQTRLEEANTKLNAAQKTQAEISNQCDAKPESHEAKVQRYEETIRTLKDALEMLA